MDYSDHTFSKIKFKNPSDDLFEGDGIPDECMN